MCTKLDLIVIDGGFECFQKEYFVPFQRVGFGFELIASVSANGVQVGSSLIIVQFFNGVENGSSVQAVD